jgi:hypothetical protein
MRVLPVCISFLLAGTALAAESGKKEPKRVTLPRDQIAPPKFTTPDPKPGTLAPDFQLETLEDPARTVKLSSFRGNRPVVLVLSSFT